MCEDLRYQAQLVRDADTEEVLVRNVMKPEIKGPDPPGPNHEIEILRLLQSFPTDKYPAPRITPCRGHGDIPWLSRKDGQPVKYSRVSYWDIYNGGPGRLGVVPPYAVLARLVRQVCETLDFMYQAGPEAVYHGSLHGHNILAHWDGESDLPDFYLSDFAWSTTAGQYVLQQQQQQADGGAHREQSAQPSGAPASQDDQQQDSASQNDQQDSNPRARRYWRPRSDIRALLDAIEPAAQVAEHYHFGRTLQPTLVRRDLDEELEVGFKVKFRGLHIDGPPELPQRTEDDPGTIADPLAYERYLRFSALLMELARLDWMDRESREWTAVHCSEEEAGAWVSQRPPQLDRVIRAARDLERDCLGMTAGPGPDPLFPGRAEDAMYRLFSMTRSTATFSHEQRLAAKRASAELSNLLIRMGKHQCPELKAMGAKGHELLRECVASGFVGRLDERGIDVYRKCVAHGRELVHRLRAETSPFVFRAASEAEALNPVVPGPLYDHELNPQGDGDGPEARGKILGPWRLVRMGELDVVDGGRVRGGTGQEEGEDSYYCDDGVDGPPGEEKGISELGGQEIQPSPVEAVGWQRYKEPSGREEKGKGAGIFELQGMESGQPSIEDKGKGKEIPEPPATQKSLSTHPPKQDNPATTHTRDGKKGGEATAGGDREESMQGEEREPDPSITVDEAMARLINTLCLLVVNDLLARRAEVRDEERPLTVDAGIDEGVYRMDPTSDW